MSEERMKKDFDRELWTSPFPFNAIVSSKSIYLEYLFEEFSKLPVRPKFHFYFNEFISDEEWEKDRSENRGIIHTSQSNEVVAANFVQTSDLERRADQLLLDFQKLSADDNVEEKYKGRYVKDMETYQILERIDKELDHFKKYAIQDRNINNYRTYARAAAKKIIFQINKLPLVELKIDLLENILDIGLENDFKVLLWISLKTKEDENLPSNFTYLKTHADEVFSESLESIRKTNEGSMSVERSFRTFRYSKYANMNFSQLIAEGEGKFIEFKKTLQVNLETAKVGAKAKQAIAKTLAAFLNSGGGVLLIGVDDKRNITGLEPDFNLFNSKDNYDKFKKSFDDLISVKFGSNFHHLINLEFYRTEDKDLCMVTIENASDQPVYVKDESNISTEFYIRRQASTISLKVNEVNPYIQSFWS
jgi:hypothetical protein